MLSNHYTFYKELERSTMVKIKKYMCTGPLHEMLLSCTAHSVQQHNASVMYCPFSSVAIDDRSYTCLFITLQCLRVAGFSLRISVDSYSSYRHGIVEVQRSGVWGRICHHGWGDEDAAVACRQMGFKARLCRCLAFLLQLVFPYVILCNFRSYIRGSQSMVTGYY